MSCGCLPGREGIIKDAIIKRNVGVRPILETKSQNISPSAALMLTIIYLICRLQPLLKSDTDDWSICLKD